VIALLFGPTLLAQRIATPVAVPKSVPVPAVTLNPQILQNFQFAHKTPMQAHFPWLTHTFAAGFLFFAISLVVLLAFQTTKQEGLSGTIGGRVESAYRPRLGFDQQVQRVTTWVACSMVFCAVILSITGI